MKHILLGLMLAMSTDAFAWGRRGHQIVGETAATLASQTPGAAGLRAHSFDMGYYANVPDIIWKKPATYAFEKPQHYMDLEIFERAFKAKPEIKDPLLLSRKEFEAAFPDIKEDAGRLFWRVRELLARVHEAAIQLRALPEQKGQARQDLQAKWIVPAGVLAHYLGDLSMPMHVSENFDGQLTGQKGIHGFFEDVCVDELYPKLLMAVNSRATKEWPAFTKANASKTTTELLTALTRKSETRMGELLKTDKKLGRDPKKVCPKYEALMIRAMTDSSLALAELYRRELGWTFDDDRFYFFDGKPEYIKPGEAEAPTPVAAAKTE